MLLTCPRFTLSQDHCTHLHRDLKLISCPNCKRFGALIFNGRLFGYSEQDDAQKSPRGQRILCNSRRKHNSGCGFAFCVRFAHTLRRSLLGTQAMWSFLTGVLRLGNKAQALRQAKANLSPSSPYRIWTRFLRAQSKIRSALTPLCKPPNSPLATLPAEQTLAHLQAAFPPPCCPLTAFQLNLQISLF